MSEALDRWEARFMTHCERFAHSVIRVARWADGLINHDPQPDQADDAAGEGKTVDVEDAFAFFESKEIMIAYRDFGARRKREKSGPEAIPDLQTQTMGEVAPIGEKKKD